MLDDLFVPDPPAGDSSNRIPNTRFVTVGLATAIATAVASAIPPAWSTYTPSLTSFLGSITSTGTMIGRFTQIGKTVFVSIDVAITTNGTGSSFLVVGLPATAAGVVGLSGFDNINLKMIYGGQGSPVITALVSNYDGTYPGANGHRYFLGGSYEAL